jgi:CO/xanthine dehydrogenase Mo-binding subunit
MSANDRKNANLTRRGALIGGAAAAGALVIGFWMPRRAQTQSAALEGAAWADEEPETPEVNAWVVVESDDTVIIRIAQTELGQGVWTSNAMMVAEELQCDWSKVKPQYASANRDDRQFPRGDELDLTRTNNKHLSFGQGIHYCVGAPLARLEGQIAFNTMLRRLPGLRLAVPKERLVWRATPIVRGLEQLPVKF